MRKYLKKNSLWDYPASADFCRSASLGSEKTDPGAGREAIVLKKCVDPEDKLGPSENIILT